MPEGGPNAEPGPLPAMPEEHCGVSERVSALRNVPTLSDRALTLIDGDRQAQYGSPEDNLTRIGQSWGAIFGTEDIPAWKVALAMAAFKVTRAAHRMDDDSLVDACGYLELAERLK